MKTFRLGIVTYDYTHLKTEQLVLRYIEDSRIEKIELFALPFQPRKEHPVLIPHRPAMTQSIPTGDLAALDKVSFRKWDGREVLADDCDYFIIGGAGILDIAFSAGKPIVNAHPGIIPLTRGLDSFKWAIFNGDPLGVTLHFIDQEVDKGEILVIRRTPVFLSDSLETLARRHYEMEIDMMANVVDFLDSRSPLVYEEKPPTMRMPPEIESQMVRKFDDWKEHVIGSWEKLSNL